MVARASRSALLYWGDESPQPLVAGIKEWTVTPMGEGIDITNNDSNGNRELLQDEAVRGVDLQLSGVVLDDTLRTDKMNGTTQQALSFVFPDGAIISGTFHLQTYNDSGTDETQVTFEASFMSSGTFTYSAAP